MTLVVHYGRMCRLFPDGVFYESEFRQFSIFFFMIKINMPINVRIISSRNAKEHGPRESGVRANGLNS